MTGVDNYRALLLRALARGEIIARPGMVLITTIKHDSWCKFLTGGVCNCDPEIVIDYKPVKKTGGRYGR